MNKKSALIKWFNYGLAISVILVNVGFLLPITLRQLQSDVPYVHNTILMVCFNCNMLIIPATIALIKGNPYNPAWLLANGIILLVILYVYYLMAVTMNLA